MSPATTLGLLLLSVSVALAGDAAPVDVTSDPQILSWSKTTLNFEAVRRQYINNVLCNVNVRAAVACTAAMTTLLNLKDKDARLVLTSKEFAMANPQRFGAIVEDLTPFAIVTGKKSATEIVRKNGKPVSADLIMADIKFRAENLEAIGRLFQNGASLNFEKFLDRYQPDLSQTPTLVGWYAARVATTMLAVNSDPHSSLATEESLRGLPEEFGFGFQLRYTRAGHYITVRGNPAKQAGLQTGDVLLKIDNTSFDQENADEFELRKLLRRPRNPNDPPSTVVVRRGTNILSFSVRSELAVTPEVDYELVQYRSGTYAAIRLDVFMPESCTKMRTAIREAQLRDIRGIILDLRDNGGGSTAAATCIASLFIGPNQLIASFDRDGFEITRDDLLTKLPMVVLVNNMSASAAEILAGTLQDYGRAWIIGTRTYGKGNYQRGGTIPLVKGVFELATQGLYYLASGRSPQLTGIIPDIEVGFDTVKVDEQAAAVLREEFTLMPLRTSEQVYKIPSNLREIQAGRPCVLDLLSKEEQKVRSNKSNQGLLIQDLQMTAALAAHDCRVSTAKEVPSEKVKTLIQKKDCDGALKFDRQMNNQAQILEIQKEITIGKTYRPDIYLHSLGYLRTQRRLAEADISADIAPFKTDFEALLKKCASKR